MAAQEGIKKLRVFSKKLDSIVDVFSSENRLVPAMANASWLDNGWNNSVSNWTNSGWNNSVSGWVNSGWNNSVSGWVNSGWSNSASGWTNSGWSNSGDGGGCYITTATVEHIGLADDCEELNMLRMYRDKLVEDDPEFKEVVLEYYKIAPQIVEKISSSPDKDDALNGIYLDMVLPVFNLLRNGQVEEAKEHYIKAYNDLKEKYIQAPQKQLVKKPEN